MSFLPNFLQYPFPFAFWHLVTLRFFSKDLFSSYFLERVEAWHSPVKSLSLIHGHIFLDPASRDYSRGFLASILLF
jgi:hypothetical protein